MSKENTAQGPQHIHVDVHGHSHELLGYLSILTEALPQIVSITDAEGRALFYNKRFYKYSGLDPNIKDPFSWAKVVHPEDLLICNQAGSEAASKGVPFELEVRCRRGDGMYRWHLMHAAPIENHETKEVVWLSCSTDIDDLKIVQAQLAESEERWRTLANAIPQIAFSTNKRGEIDFCNHRAGEYMGLSDEQIFNGGWKLLVHPQDLQEYERAWNHSIETGDTFELRFRLKRAVGLGDTQYRVQLARAVAMRGKDGSILRWFASWTEVEG